MAEPGIEIEQVVREVMARLGQAPPAACAAPRDGSGPMRSETETPAAPRMKQAETPAQGELVLDSRVVTLNMVDGRLDAVQWLVVPPDSVVTPAVRDLLRERGIALTFAVPRQEHVGGADTRLVWITTGTPYDPAALIDAVRKEGVAIEPAASNCLIETTDRLAGELTRPDTLGVVLTRHVAAALCLANRHVGVRAVSARDPDEVSRAASAVGANLLVLNPAGLSLFTLRRLIAEFYRGGVRECPEVFTKQLG